MRAMSSRDCADHCARIDHRSPIAASAFDVFAEEKFLGRKEGADMRITRIFQLGQNGYERGGDWGDWGGWGNWGGWGHGWGGWGHGRGDWGGWGHRWGGWGHGLGISLHLNL